MKRKHHEAITSPNPQTATRKTPKTSDLSATSSTQLNNDTFTSLESRKIICEYLRTSVVTKNADTDANDNAPRADTIGQEKLPLQQQEGLLHIKENQENTASVNQLEKSNQAAPQFSEKTPPLPSSILTLQHAFNALYHRGITLYKQENFHLAQVFLEGATELNVNSNAFLFLCLLWIRFGEMERGCKFLEHLEQRALNAKMDESASPAAHLSTNTAALLKNSNFFLMKGIFYHNLGRMQEAINEASKSLNLSRHRNVLALMLKGDSLKFLPVLDKSELKFYRKVMKLAPRLSQFIGKGFGNDWDWKSEFEPLVKQYCSDNYSKTVLSESDMQQIFQFNDNQGENLFGELRDEIFPPPKPGLVYSVFPLLQYDRNGKPQPKPQDSFVRLQEEERKASVLLASTKKRKEVPGLDMESLLILQENTSRNYRTLWNEPNGFERAKLREKKQKHRMEHFLLAGIKVSFSDMKSLRPDRDTKKSAEMKHKRRRLRTPNRTSSPLSFYSSNRRSSLSRQSTRKQRRMDSSPLKFSASHGRGFHNSTVHSEILSEFSEGEMSPLKQTPSLINRRTFLTSPSSSWGIDTDLNTSLSEHTDIWLSPVHPDSAVKRTNTNGYSAKKPTHQTHKRSLRSQSSLSWTSTASRRKASSVASPSKRRITSLERSLYFPSNEKRKPQTSYGKVRGRKDPISAAQGPKSIPPPMRRAVTPGPGMVGGGKIARSSASSKKRRKHHQLPNILSRNKRVWR